MSDAGANLAGIKKFLSESIGISCCICVLTIDERAIGCAESYFWRGACNFVIRALDVLKGNIETIERRLFSKNRTVVEHMKK
jgi:hypothetical protein